MVCRPQSTYLTENTSADLMRLQMFLYVFCAPIVRRKFRL